VRHASPAQLAAAFEEVHSPLCVLCGCVRPYRLANDVTRP